MAQPQNWMNHDWFLLFLQKQRPFSFLRQGVLFELRVILVEREREREDWEEDGMIRVCEAARRIRRQWVGQGSSSASQSVTAPSARLACSSPTPATLSLRSLPSLPKQTLFFTREDRSILVYVIWTCNWLTDCVVFGINPLATGLCAHCLWQFQRKCGCGWEHSQPWLVGHCW